MGRIIEGVIIVIVDIFVNLKQTLKLMLRNRFFPKLKRGAQVLFRVPVLNYRQRVFKRRNNLAVYVILPFIACNRVVESLSALNIAPINAVLFL